MKTELKDYQEIIQVVYIGNDSKGPRSGELIDVVFWVDDEFILAVIPKVWSASYTKISQLLADFRFPANLPFGSIGDWRKLRSVDGVRN